MCQKQLAEKVGVDESVIVSLEDSDYDNNSLIMLDRIAETFNQEMKINFIPINQTQKQDKSYV